MPGVTFAKGEVSYHCVVKVEIHKPKKLVKDFYTSFFVTEDDGTVNEITFYHAGPELTVGPVDENQEEQDG